MKKSKNAIVWANLKNKFFEVKIKRFFVIFAIFNNIVRFWATHMQPEGAGTQPKIFWGHKTLYLRICELKIHVKISPPLSRPSFVQKPRFLHIFGQWRNFWTPVSSRRAAGGPRKFFGRSHTTLKHSTIILGWSEDPKGSSQKKLPPPKNDHFWGGGKTLNIPLNPLCFKQ